MVFYKEDLITINGNQYRYVETTDDGQIFERLDIAGLHESFSHMQLWSISRTNSYRYDRGYFSKSQATLRASFGARDMSAYEPEDVGTMLVRADCCDAILALRGSGQLKLTEKSLTANADKIALKVEELIASRNGASMRNAGADRKERTKQLTVVKFVPPCARTMLEWVRKYRRAKCHPLALMHKLKNCGNRTLRQEDPEAASLLAATAAGYADPKKPTLAKIAKDVVQAFEEANVGRAAAGLPEWRIPGRKAVRAAVRRLDPFATLCKREGVEGAKKLAALVRDGLNVSRPGDRIQIDEWEIDFHALVTSSGIWELLSASERKKIKRGRYWLSVAIDCATRVILAMRILRKPSSEGALATLEMACSDKGIYADAAGALSTWHQFVDPKAVETDWGAGYIKARFRSAVADLGATMEFPPAGAAAARGMIERWFGTASVQIAGRMHGKSFSNVVLRGDYPSEDLAGLTEDEIQVALIRYVVDVYHNSPHSGLNGETPYDCWERLVRASGSDAPIDSHKKRTLFGQDGERTATNRGLRYLGNHYRCPELDHAFLHTHQRKFKIRVDLNNLGAMSVKIGDAYYPADCQSDGMEGVSARNWIETNTILRAKFRNSAKLNRSIVLAALADIEALNDGSLRRANLAAPLPTDDEVTAAERDIFFEYELLDDHDPTSRHVLGDVISPAEIASELQEIRHENDRRKKQEKTAGKKSKTAPAAQNSEQPADDDSSGWTEGEW